MRRPSPACSTPSAVAVTSESVLFEIARWTTELTDSPSGAVFVGDGDEIAVYNFRREEGQNRVSRPFGDDSALTRVLRERVTLAFDDQSNIDEPGFSQSVEIAQSAGIRSSVFAPIKSDGPPVGVAAFRRVIEPFSNDEIELLESFAVPGRQCGDQRSSHRRGRPTQRRAGGGARAANGHLGGAAPDRRATRRP